MAIDSPLPTAGQVADGTYGYWIGNSYVTPNRGLVWDGSSWVSPLTYQTNQLASQRLGFETQSAGVKAQADQNAANVAVTAGNRLNTLLQDPSSVADTPAYKFAFNQGMEGVNRTAAAKGMLGSGNRLYDLTKFGQGLASQTYNNTVSQLGNYINKTPMGNSNTYQTNTGTNQATLSGTY